MLRRPFYRMRKNERLVAGIIYLGAIVPLWGILMAWALREAWRERSRHVIYHATQAIWMQTGLLFAFVVYALFLLGCGILSVVGEEGGALLRALDSLRAINLWIMIAFASFYALLCLACSWLVLDGRRVKMPVIGRRIYEQEFGPRQGMEGEGNRAGKQKAAP